MAPLAIPVGGALLRWGLPAAIGAGASLLDDDPSVGGVAGGALSGLVGGGMGAGAARLGLRFMPNNALGWIGGRNMFATAPAMGALGSTLFGDGEDKHFINNRWWEGIAPQLEVRPEYDPSYGFGSFWKSISPLYDDSAAKFTGKNMMQWMADNRTNKIVDETIRAENKPIRELIKEEKANLSDDLHNIQVLDEEYQRSIDNKTRRLTTQQRRSLDDQREHISDVRDDADQALSNILSMYNVGDDSDQRSVVEEAAERRVPREDHTSDITSINTGALAESAAIEGMQASQDKRNRKKESRQTVRAARGQISSNWSKKRGMLAELASQMADDDLQRYGLDIQNKSSRNNFLSTALQMFPQFGAGKTDPYSEAYYKAAGKAAGEAILGTPIEVTQQNDAGGQVKQFFSPNQWNDGLAQQYGFMQR